MGKYLGEFLRSFGKWWWAVVVDYIFGLAGVYQTVTATTTLSQIGWAIVFVLAFTIPPLIAFIRVGIIRDKLQRKLDAIENARPNIELFGTENIKTPIRYVETGALLGEPVLTQVNFANNPSALSLAVDATCVAGHIDIYVQDGKLLFSMIGRWSETKEEAHGAQPTEMEQITIPPNGRPNPMDIVLKYQQDQLCYGHTNKSRRLAPYDWRDSQKQMAIGTYLVRVRLRGSNVDKEFWFSLINRGTGTDIQVQALTSVPSIPHREIAHEKGEKSDTKSSSQG